MNRSDTAQTRIVNVSCAHEAAGRQVLGERQVMAGSRSSECFPKAANGKDTSSAKVSYAESIPKGSTRPTPVL
ncbi:MAG: hypothetical protein GY792_06480 [Gammaproteobacteria bacterium]|nr:hypothetical protein [Gammaproteobacteria bacterium]